jgi:hypothetical protein
MPGSKSERRSQGRGHDRRANRPNRHQNPGSSALYDTEMAYHTMFPHDEAKRDKVTADSFDISDGEEHPDASPVDRSSRINFPPIAHQYNLSQYSDGQYQLERERIGLRESDVDFQTNPRSGRRSEQPRHQHRHHNLSQEALDSGSHQHGGIETNSSTTAVDNPSEGDQYVSEHGYWPIQSNSDFRYPQDSDGVNDGRNQYSVSFVMNIKFPSADIEARPRLPSTCHLND